MKRSGVVVVVVASLGAIWAISSVYASRFSNDDSGLRRATFIAQPADMKFVTNLGEQVNEMVLRSLEVNASVRTESDWIESGFTAKDIFANVAALASQNRDIWKDLCLSLSALPGEDLALFEDAIADAKVDDFSCQKILAGKIAAYWQASRKEFQVEVAANELKTESVLLETISKEIDSRLGETLVYADLPANQIAITFDDGPHPSRTAKILEILSTFKVKATFFQVGRAVRSSPEVSRAVFNNGHTLASHTMTHPNLRKLAMKSMRRAEAEILEGRDIIKQLVGVDTPFFRFPYGASSESNRSFLKKNEMTSFLWSIDTLDWKIRNPSTLLKRIQKQLDKTDRGIILFHDIHQQTVIVLPAVLQEFAARGITPVVFVPLNQ